MSTLKTINIIHPSGSTNNIVNDASGNITVGNNATVTGGLTVTGTLTGSTGVMNIGSGQLYKDASGNVGVGTSSPGYRLDVNSGSNFIAGRFTSTSTATIIPFVDSTTTGIGPYVGSTGNALTFGRAGVSEYMRIDSSGNVLVGGTTAFGKLSLYANGVYASSGSMNSGMTISNGTGGGALNIGVNDTGSFSTSYTWLNSGYINNSNSPLPFVLATGGSEQMRIDTSGNVGIGTSSPSSPLDVNGTITARCPPGGTGLLMRGRSADNLSQILGYDFGVTTLYGQIQFVPTGGGSTTFISNGATGYTNFYTNGSERARIDSSGNLLVGQTAVTGNGGKLQVSNSTGNAAQFIVTAAAYPIVASNNGSGSGLIYFNYNSTNIGTITTNGTTTSYNVTSDYRLKENVVPMTMGLATIAALKPVNYDWISTKEQGEGFIAHELQEVIPHAVTGEKDAVDENGKPIHQGVDYSKIVVHLVAACQELKAQNDELKARVAALEAK